MQPQFSTLIKDMLRLTLGAAASLVLPPVTRFVILSNGRSGSNLLVSLMRSHPEILQHGEIFGEFQLESRAVRRRINRAGICAYLDRRLSRMTTETAAGVKILYNNIEKRYGEVRGVPGIEALPDHIRADQRIKVIHLIREDKLAMLISIRLASESGRYTSGSYGDRTVHLPVDWVREQFAEIESRERRVDALFPPERLHRLTYEALVADKEENMRRVFAFLDLEAAPIHSAMRRQNKRGKAEIVENFGELRQAFAGTRYAPLFEN